MSVMQAFRDGPTTSVDEWWVWKWLILPLLRGLFSCIFVSVDLLVAWGIHSWGLDWTRSLLVAALYSLAYLTLQVRDQGKERS